MDTQQVTFLASAPWPKDLPLTDGEAAIQAHWWKQRVAGSGQIAVGEPTVELRDWDEIYPGIPAPLDSKGVEYPFAVVTTGTVRNVETSD